MAVIGRDFGERIGDAALASTPFWKFLIFANKSIRDIVARTGCLRAYTQLTGAMRLTIVSFAALTGDSVTVTIDGVATTKTAGVDWTAATSNAATATSLATALSAISGVIAYADSSYVYVLGSGGSSIDSITTTDATNLTIADDGYELLLLSSILTRVREVQNIYDTINELIYKPLSAQQYDRLLIDSTFAGYAYYVDPSYGLFIKAAGVNLDSSNAFNIDYTQWPAALTLATESAPGVLSEWDEVVLNRALYYYWQTQAKYDIAAVCMKQFELDVRQVRSHLHSQGEVQEQQLFYQWH